MDAAAIRCPSCGAPLPEDAVQCPYCRNQVATVACPKCFALVPLQAHHCPQCGTELQLRQQDEHEALVCPGCRNPLALATVGNTPIHLCAHCAGIWLDQHIFEALAADPAEQGQLLAAAGGGAEKVEANLEQVQYRPCPRCKRLMNRSNYARISGVILDTCKEHGIWFDRDELRRVLAFIRSGGLVKADRHEKESLERLRKEVQRSPGAGSAWSGGDGGSFMLGGGSMEHDVETLVDAARVIFRFFRE